MPVRANQHGDVLHFAAHLRFSQMPSSITYLRYNTVEPPTLAASDLKRFSTEEYGKTLPILRNLA